eukprot:SAG31_NODE_220_length_19925_cov_3.630939_3_plen_105_part_00
MTTITNASTPTLIQHGELDLRVPIANGYELCQGLEDNGVPTEMVVYTGYGHGITKPKSVAAVLHHNLVWFDHWIFGPGHDGGEQFDSTKLTTAPPMLSPVQAKL